MPRLWQNDGILEMLIFLQMENGISWKTVGMGMLQTWPASVSPCDKVEILLLPESKLLEILCYQGTIKLHSSLFVKGIRFLRSILPLKYKVIVLLEEEEDCLLSCHLLLA